MKPRGFNPDVILRGLVMYSPEEETDMNQHEYCLFHTNDDSEEYAYYDYATEDDETASESSVDFNEDDNESDVNDANEITHDVSKETLSALLKAKDDAKVAAENAENVYKQYISSSAS